MADAAIEQAAALDTVEEEAAVASTAEEDKPTAAAVVEAWAYQPRQHEPVVQFHYDRHIHS